MTKLFFNADHNRKISHLLCSKLDELLDHLGVSYEKQGNCYFGPCPVHSGDNPIAWNLYEDGHTTSGNWCCFTRHCEKNKTTPPNILGFVNGVLRQKNRCSNFYCSLLYCLEFLKIKSLDELNKIELPKRVNTQAYDVIYKTNQKLKHYLSRKDVRGRLEMPATPLIERGLSEKILDMYDVGICRAYGKEMYNRIVFPIYDEKNKFLVGCVGRSLFPQCKICDLYHDGNCPDIKYGKRKYAKWINNNGFKAASYLFNYWAAREEIEKTNTVCLVEGQLDVLKLVEAGVPNSVGIFGDDISDEQLILLEKTGVLNLVLLLDNDKAGQKAKQRIRECCGKLYNIIEPKYPKKDIMELTNEEIEQYIKRRLGKFF